MLVVVFGSKKYDKRIKMIKNFKRILYYINYLVLVPMLNKFADPLISFKLNGRSIKIPLSHRLPFYLYLSDLYSQNVGRIGKIIKNKYNDLCAIEVGANVGDTVTILRSYSNYLILGIEGDPIFFKLLNINTKDLGDVYTENYFLGDKEVTTRLNFQSDYGTGGLTSGSNKISIKTLDSVLKRKSQFKNAKYLITDTDGFDFNVIKGGINFIKRSKPVIFFEFDPDFILRNKQNPREIFDLLDKMGYFYYIVYDNMGDLIYSFDIKKDPGYFRLLRYMYKKNNRYYADVTCFHKSDRDLFLNALSDEDGFYNKRKGYI